MEEKLADRSLEPKTKSVINIDDILAFSRVLKKLEFKIFRLCTAGVTLAVVEVAALLLLASFINTALQQPDNGVLSPNFLDYLQLSNFTFIEQAVICLFVFCLRFLSGLLLQNFILLQSSQLQTSLRLLLFHSTLNNRGNLLNEEQKASGAMSDIIVRQVTQVGKGILEPFLKVLGELVILFGIIAVVLVVSPGFLLLMLTIITPIVLFYLLKFKRLSRRFGDRANQSLEEVSEMTAAFCAGWRQLSVRSLQNNSVSMLSKSSNKFARNDRLANLLSGAPRYFLELFLALFLIIMVAWAGRSEEMGFAELVFVAGAGLRILPIITSISNALISFQFNRAVLQNVVGIIEPSIDQLIFQLKNPIETDFKAEDSLNNCSIRLDNIAFKYHSEKSLFEGLSEELKSGDFLLIKGRSGVGKTTLMDVICGIRAPSTGAVLFNGMQLQYKTKHSVNIFYAPQQPLIIPGTILENVVMSEEKNITELQQEKASTCLKMVDLWNELQTSQEFINRSVGPDGDKLSGGQKQRLVLARALYHGAEVLALDEIVSGLEEDSKRKILTLLQKLANESKLIILISHDPIAGEFSSKCITL